MLDNQDLKLYKRFMIIACLKVYNFVQIALERSLSAEALHRITLPDDAWLVEKTGDRELIEKQKAFHELEMVKQARLETLEVIENMELERPSSR